MSLSLFLSLPLSLLQLPILFLLPITVSSVFREDGLYEKELWECNHSGTGGKRRIQRKETVDSFRYRYLFPFPACSPAKNEKNVRTILI